MYLSQSIIDGLKILGFDKETIRRVSRERNLEEIFLSTLFLNYLIVLVAYIVGLIQGGFWIGGKEVNMPVLFGLLMIYPFVFNVLVYVVYGFFGLMAELINVRKHIKPLVAVGFHTAIVYALIIYVIGLIATINLSFSWVLFVLFVLWFLYTMFISISTIYNYSFGQILIVIFLPFLLLSLALVILNLIFPDIILRVLALLFA